jgi:tetratricopeptide (TPR) repeat protein
MSAPIARDYFISRTGADKALAIAIAAIVREAGFTTWLQDEDFGHASFVDRMHEGFESGARVIALLSKDYQESEYCRKECNVPLAADPLNRNGGLIVLRVQDCAPKGVLRDLAYTDLVHILAISDIRKRERILRRKIREVIGASVEEDGEADTKPTSEGRYQQAQVLHDEIRAVPGFTGREAELAAIRAALWNGGAAALTGSPAATALSGLGGVGKSVLAREYAWRERERYRGVWWLRAEERATLMGDLIELGARFIPGLAEVPDREAAARATLDFIAQTPADKPWLLVYDNAENPAGLEKLTPRAGAHVLVTSRWQDWHGRARELPLDVFSEAAALEFLMAQARGAGVAANSKGLSPHPVPLPMGEGTKAATVEQGSLLPRGEGQDEGRDVSYNPQIYEAAAKLAQDLGRLPLALAIARAHAWSMGWTFAQYREHLAEAKLLEREETKGVDYPRSIAATFTLAIEKASETCPQAEQLLSIAAFLAPERIPLSIILEAAMPEMEKGEAVAALAEVSLVTRETLDDGSPAVGVHRLVQEFMRQRLGDHAAAVGALATVFMALAYPSLTTDVRSWPSCRRLNSHAAAVLVFAPDVGKDAGKTSHLLRNYGMHLWARGEFTQAEPLLRRALAIDERCFGPDHIRVAGALNNLAGLLKDAYRLSEAEVLFKRCIAIFEKIERDTGDKHPNYGGALNNLAQLLTEESRLSEAEPLMRRALAIDAQRFAPGHPNLAIRLNNLADLLTQMNRLSEAEPLIRGALDIDVQNLGPDHPDVAISLNNLANLLEAMKRHSEAEPLLRKALKIFEKVERETGYKHPNHGGALCNLAALLQTTNRPTDAEPLIRYALAIDENSFGPNHPNVSRDLSNLAQLLQTTKRYDEAEPLMRRALESDETCFGPNHPDVAVRLNNLAGLLQTTNRLAEAEPLMRRAHAIWEESLGAEHPNTKTGRRNLKALLAAIGLDGRVKPRHDNGVCGPDGGAGGRGGGAAGRGTKGAPRRGLFARLFRRG